MAGFYYYGYFRMHLMAETLALRFPDASAEIKQTPLLFHNRLRDAVDVMLTCHLDISQRGETKDGVAFLLHKALVPSMRPVVEFAHHLIGADPPKRVP